MKIISVIRTKLENQIKLLEEAYKVQNWELVKQVIESLSEHLNHKEYVKRDFYSGSFRDPVIGNCPRKIILVNRKKRKKVRVLAHKSSKRIVSINSFKGFKAYANIVKEVRNGY